MSFFTLLGNFFIGPLKLLFEAIYAIAYDVIGSPGLSIIFLSLCMNILVLPLYRRADAMQEEVRDSEEALKRGVTHIKKTFSGNERMMMLQTYYRQNNYSPLHSLKGSVSLLLEIPFFMAAYQFLSGLGILKDVPFGPIADLSAPDGLLNLGFVTLNLLPILMTVINVISSAVYLKGFPLKSKIKLYVIALFFLVFLYSSPSGLVFYWTLNNLFSLFKNIYYKTGFKMPKNTVFIFCTVCGAGLLLLYALAGVFGNARLRGIPVLTIGCCLLIPALLRLIKLISIFKNERKDDKPNKWLFLVSSAFVTVFVGVLIPSAYIASSPQEFVFVADYLNPVWYIVNSGVTAAGTFVLWFGVFYWLASPRGKVVFEKIMVIFSFVVIIDYMFFGRNLGLLKSDLSYDSELYFSLIEWVVNAVIFIALSVLIYKLASRWKRAFSIVLVAGVLTTSVMSGINIASTVKSIALIDLNKETVGETPGFTLSRGGKNVVVIMLDRAMGELVPYIINERPDIAEAFDGFTYYSNVISYGGHTNMGVPAMIGGYEYTPVEMNKRDTELLVDKHNEALKVLPVTFLNAGYTVTVCDPPYAGYQWYPDLSIYDDYPQIRKFITKGKFSDPDGGIESKAEVLSNNETLIRNFFCFSLMKSSPLPLQYLLYNGGCYNTVGSIPPQVVAGTHNAYGVNQTFANTYYVLKNLSSITSVTDGDENTFLFFENETTHEPALLLEPEYEIAPEIDNSEFDKEHEDRFTVYDENGNKRSINVTESSQMESYHINMAAFLKLGEWFDYLRENGVYDNTRIIIVADHGWYEYMSDELSFGTVNGSEDADISNYFPLLLVKDFYAHGFKTSDEFMTNADTPTLALEGLIDDPVNPFTGKPINSDEKTAHDQFILTYRDWDTEKNNGKTFSPGTWASVKDDIWNADNWDFYNDNTVLKEHKMPD